ncbi:MAG: class I SAM-dependent methyltransferase [Mycobacterium sp.]
MSNDPKSDVINRQYERWTYPAPIEDIPDWLNSNWQWYDPTHAHPVLWPDRGYRPGMDILIAGCGTNQAAVFAYNNRDAKVVGVDISQASLDHQRHLKDKYGLDNLELHLLPIEELPSLGRQFDLVVSTGVLMVMADPQAGMNALAQCVRPDGAVAIMVYAKYGRHGVTLLQSVFRDLGLGQDEESVRMVRLATSMVGPDHPVRSYFKIAPDLEYDAGVVDTFLIGRELTYNVEDCLGLIEGAGLVFQTWLLNSPYYAHDFFEPGNAFYAAVNELPSPRHWSVMDRFRATNGCHFFVACRPERPRESYAIDFSSDRVPDYVPVFRFRSGFEGNRIYRSGYQMELPPEQVALMLHVDGSRSIREITRLAAAQNGTVTPEYARRFFEALWRLDFVTPTFKG